MFRHRPRGDRAGQPQPVRHPPALTIGLIAGTYQPDRCGVAHYTAHLRKALGDRNIHSIVFTTHEAAAVTNDAQVRGVVSDWDMANLLPLLRALRSTPVDLLHIQHAAGTYGFQRALFLLPPLLRLAGYSKPIVTTVHEYGWWEWYPPIVPPQVLEWLKTWGQSQGWWDREDGFLLTGSDALITTNQDANRVILSRLPHYQQRVHTIPIGANIKVMAGERLATRTQVRQQWGWAEEEAIAVFFGFLHPVKGLETLLPAFKQVLTVHPTARLLLVGGVESLALRDQDATQYWHRLQQLIADLQLTDRVRMTGYLDATEVSRYLTAADVGVLPFNHGVTLKSGSLLALMAHALPVIATRSHPSDPDLEQADLVRLVPPKDIDQLTNALIQLLVDTSLRQHLGRMGQEYSRQFSWSAIADAHATIYQQLMQ